MNLTDALNTVMGEMSKTRSLGPALADYIRLVREWMDASEELRFLRLSNLWGLKSPDEVPEWLVSAMNMTRKDLVKALAENSERVRVVTDREEDLSRQLDEALKTLMEVGAACSSRDRVAAGHAEKVREMRVGFDWRSDVSAIEKATGSSSYWPTGR